MPHSLPSIQPSKTDRFDEVLAASSLAVAMSATPLEQAACDNRESDR